MYCMSTGGHLVALETSEEQNFLADYATQHNGGSPFLYYWRYGAPFTNPDYSMDM